MRGPIAIAAAMLAGCSFIAVPSVRTTGEYRDEKVAESCTDSRAAPVTDVLATALGGLFLINAYRHLSNDEPGSSDDPGTDELLAIGLGLPGAIMVPVYGVSAIFGFRHVGRCRAELAKPPAPT